MTLSVCLIVKNEEDVIERCLKCVKKFADEIIVVDTGSTDSTVEKSKKFTDKIYSFNWIDDFSAARNYSLGLATCDFVMWLDADDVVTDENCGKITSLMRAPKFDMAFLKYAAGFDGDAPTFLYYRERIFRRSLNYRFAGAVHEAVAPQGEILYSDAEIQHRKLKEGEPLRNLRIFQKKIMRGEELSEREKFYYGRELLFNGMFRESIAVLEDYLRCDGWLENRIEACLNLYRAYAALGENEMALSSALRSFTMAPPRSEACCVLGENFLKKNDLQSAEFWYKAALECGQDIFGGGFVNADWSGFVPLMQLCVIYDRMGDIEKANAFNERAGLIKPKNQNYLYNREYFKNKLGKEV